MTADLRVLEVSDGVAAQMAGFMFAELGARVTKLSFTGETSHSPQLEFALDRGKDGLVSGRSEAAGRLVEMSADHDVVILGSDWMDVLAGEHVRERLPRVVWLVLAGSESGSHPADGMLAEAASGLMSRQQGRREGPYCVTEPMAAYGAGLIGTTAALAALLRRLDTGVGDVVETSYLEGAVAVQAMSACFTLESGPEPVRYRDPYCVSMTPAIRFHRAADGWVLIGTVTAVQWQRLLTMVGKQALLGDERLDGAPLIMRDQAIGEEIAGAISAFVGQRSVDECLRRCQAEGIVAAPVLDHERFLAHPQCEANGLPARRKGADGIERTGLGRVMRFVPLAGETRGRLPGEKRSASGEGPLAGITVVDIASFVATPTCGRILADLGAGVIKVEAPGGDPLRRLGLGFSLANRGKRSVVLNLKTDEGRGVLHRLLDGADVLLSNHSARGEAEFGLALDQLSSRHPGLIKLHIGGFGNTGPLGGRLVIDAAAQALSGASLAQGGGHEPVGFTGALLDSTAGWLGAVGILWALLQKRRTGSGCVIETNLLNTAALFQTRSLVAPVFAGEPRVDDEMLGYSALQRLYRVRDGWICVNASDPRDRARLRDIAGEYGVDVPATDSPPAPGDLWARLEEVFARFGMEHWQRAFASHGFRAWTRVASLEALARGPQGILIRLAQEPWGEVLQPDRPVRFRRFPAMPPLTRGAPAVPGIDTFDVLQASGYSPAEIDALIEAGAIERSPTPVPMAPLTV